MKLIRKLIVGISTLCLLVMTFVSATYAWFEINSRASVENFHFEVHGGQGFLVSIDNVNYYNDLNLTQLQKAMLVAYGEGKYKIDDDGSEKLYEIRYEDDYDEQMNPIVVEVKDELDETTIAKRVKDNVKLLPVTSFNGRDFSDQYKSSTENFTPGTGKYVEFSIYFRTQSRRIEDNFAYDIYLNGEETQADDGSLVEPTTITSEKSEYSISANMNAAIQADDGKYIITAYKRVNSENQRDKVTVFSSNAVRLSITNQEYYEEYQMDGNDYVLDENGQKIVTKKDYRLVEDNPTKIYELNDTNEENRKFDLGSYATNYSGGYSDDELNAMVTEQGTLIDDENLALYCYKFNAMYTYYNNIKPTDTLEQYLLDYADKPTTIRNLASKDVITRVKAGEEANKVTFRLWLEGWDADCFDGIEYAVKARLAFGSKRVDL